ncbi:MAG TPA: hypothetical protein VHP99_16580, partial [Pyrinomonadaceae bacterium]|nr:hypothetical protein [Pyrinomonadaceae bacterium]
MNPNKSLINIRGRRASTPPIQRRPRSPLRFYGSLALALAMLAAIGSSQFRKADAQNNRARVQQDLADVFTGYEQLQVDPRLVAEQVRTTGRVSLVTAAQDFEVQLQPNDLRAPNYRAEQTDPDGAVRATAMPGLTTYKGNVEGLWASDARFTIDGQKIEGMIITAGQSYFVESAQKYSKFAAPTDYL